MTTTKPLQYIILLILTILTDIFSAAPHDIKMILVGSTPGGQAIKTMLTIPRETRIDFIRWRLNLDDKNGFSLDITYGESQPNTLGFINGGHKKTFKGTYHVKQEQHSRFKEIYELKSNGTAEAITLVRLNENVFHLLDPQGQLMIGNGGWSYSLNKKETARPGTLLITSQVSDDHSTELVFDGRTPCQEFAAEYPEMQKDGSCFKLKWRLILYKDPVTHVPTTCSIRNIVGNEPRNITAKWEIIKGTPTNPGTVIYRISIADVAKPVLLLALDDNILYFIDQQKDLFTGNEDFSFALNRVK